MKFKLYDIAIFGNASCQIMLMIMIFSVANGWKLKMKIYDWRCKWVTLCCFYHDTKINYLKKLMKNGIAFSNKLF
jgi:hypothetical protein